MHCLLTPACRQYDYLVREKIADGGLIAKWRKPGYENLCSMLAIQKGDHNFGTTSICRVPIGSRAGHQARDVVTERKPAALAARFSRALLCAVDES